jgi:apolipoprotein N-acyltransferase
MRGTWQTTDSGGDGIGAILGVIGVIVLAAAVAGPIVAAVTELVRLIVISVIVVVVLAVIGGAALVTLRLRHGPPRALPPHSLLSAPREQEVTTSQPRALPARQELHIHFHGLSAEDVAAILARQNGE